MATDRFTKMQKVAIFLIALGEDRTREILADVDLDTVQQVNAAIASLGKITPEEKAGVMLEFAHFSTRTNRSRPILPSILTCRSHRPCQIHWHQPTSSR